MSAPRVGLIGARRRRQGLGPFVARHLHDAGAEVTCFLATSAASAEETERSLARALGTRPRGYTEAEAMIAEESLAALAILSPHETHERYLDLALRARLPVLCEKPLVWGGSDPVAAARRLVDGFVKAELPLFENCQLPYWFLDDPGNGARGGPGPHRGYAALFPSWRSEPLRRFEMRLSPITRGGTALVDSLPHPLSVLQTVSSDPSARIEQLRFEPAPSPEAERSALHFLWSGPSPGVEVTVELARQPEPPRPLEIALNGARARREIREPGYQMFLRSGGTAVPVVDPEAQLVRDFVQTLRGAPVPALPISNPQDIIRRMELLAEMVTAFGAAEDRT